MKLKSFYALLIFILSLSVLFVSNNNAQSKSSKNEQINEEKEKLEVQKFVDSFIQKLDETKDLNEVPESFFIEEFRKRQVNNNNFDFYDSNLLPQLSEIERIEYNLDIINHYYLGYRCIFERVDWDYYSENNESLEELFPAEVIELLKKYKILSYSEIDDDNVDEPQISNIAELRELMSLWKKILQAERNYLSQSTPQRKYKFAKNLEKAKNQFDEIRIYDCKEPDSCFGFPANSRLIRVVTFPLTLNIKRENGLLKIVDIYPFFQ